LWGDKEHVKILAVHFGVTIVVLSIATTVESTHVGVQVYSPTWESPDSLEYWPHRDLGARLAEYSQQHERVLALAFDCEHYNAIVRKSAVDERYGASGDGSDDDVEYDEERSNLAVLSVLSDVVPRVDLKRCAIVVAVKEACALTLSDAELCWLAWTKVTLFSSSVQCFLPQRMHVLSQVPRVIGQILKYLAANGRSLKTWREALQASMHDTGADEVSYTGRATLLLCALIFLCVVQEVALQQPEYYAEVGSTTLCLCMVI